MSAWDFPSDGERSTQDGVHKGPTQGWFKSFQFRFTELGPRCPYTSWVLQTWEPA